VLLELPDEVPDEEVLDEEVLDELVLVEDELPLLELAGPAPWPLLLEPLSPDVDELLDENPSPPKSSEGPVTPQAVVDPISTTNSARSHFKLLSISSSAPNRCWPAGRFILPGKLQLVKNKEAFGRRWANGGAPEVFRCNCFVPISY